MGKRAPLLICLLLLPCAVGCGDGTESGSSFTAPVDSVVDFPDPNLESSVRDNLGKPQGDILVSDLRLLTTLVTGKDAVSDLTGLEHCENLAFIYLSHNAIADISALSSLSKLIRLHLADNHITDIAPLADLTGLIEVNLRSNQIHDIDPLAALVNLHEIDLADNLIDSVTPLANLTSLIEVDLEANRISDISPLAALVNLREAYFRHNLITDVDPLLDVSENLRYVDLIQNPLDMTSCEQIIPQLKSGSYVLSDCTHLNRSVSVVVDSDLEPKIRDSLNQYIQDLTTEGYAPEILVFGGSSPDELRSALLARHTDTPGLVGAVLIGNLPVFWASSHPRALGEEFQKFPCDYFYMDLDGEWSDTYEILHERAPDGIADSHTPGGGDLGPEIWVGRILAHNLFPFDEAELINNYLRKNHAYRVGALTLNQRALVYVDDEWAGYDPEDNIKMIYDEYDLYSAPSTTRASHYKSALEVEHEFVHLLCHTAPWAHGFQDSHSPLPPPLDQIFGGMVFSWELMNLDPKAFFYVLDACYSGRFTEPWYIGAAYIFSRTYGLLAISMSGTSKPIGWDDSGTLYPGLSIGKSFGDTFVDWYTKRVVGTCPDWHTSQDCSWGRTSHRMQVLLGDPTLRMKTPVMSESAL